MTNDTIYDGISANLNVQADYSACGAAYSVASAVNETAISTFTISGSKTAFIAGYEGLTWNDFKSGYDGYYYQSESVIDAEKCTAITQDNMMCWAGTAANMLYYTGWDLLDTASEDSVFSVFIDHFTLGELYGGNPYYGIKWFFTGDYTPASWSEWDQPISNSGGYYSDFFETKAVSNYLTSKTFNVSNLTTAREKLEDGYGVGITFGYYNSSGERTGGHVITLWGMTCDTSLSVTDPNYYTGIIVTDSDDNKNVSDPLTAKDTLKIIEISYDSSRGQYVLDPDYAGQNCILENLTFLAPNTSANPNSTAPVKIYSNNILVKEGTTFTDEQILADGNNKMLVSSGGTVNRTFNSRARIELFGGLANSTTVTAAGVIYIYEGGTATSTTVDDKSSIGIHADGLANITAVNSGGEMYVFSRGTANSTTINSSGRGNVLGGGVANKVNVSNGGVLELRSGENSDNYEPDYASANNVTVFSGGSAVISGGVVSRLLVSSGGIATVNGIPDTMHVDVYGEMYNTEVKSGGNLTIGTKTQFWGTTVFGGTITVNDNTDIYGEVTFDLSERKTADSFIVDNLAYLNMTMGSSYNITVTANQVNGTYKLAQGANNFTGTLTIGDKTSNYGSITVNGADFVYNGKSYSLDQANGDLTLTIGNGTTPPISGDQVQVYSSGTLVKQGKVLTGETIVSGANNSMFVYDGGTANETVINSKGYMYVSSGGVANKTSVYNDWGTIKIYNSGIAKDTYISGFCAEMYISAGGFASNTDIAYGRMTIYGTASSTTLKTADIVTVGSGGIADKVETNGHVGIYVSGLLRNATIKGSGGHFASVEIREGGSANKIVLNYFARMRVAKGGSAANMTINSNGSAYVSAGGFAKDITVTSSGGLTVLGEEYAATEEDYPEALHGSAKDVTVYSKGYARVSGGEVTNLLVSSGGSAFVMGVEDVSYVDVSGCIRNGEIKSGGSLTIGNGTELWEHIIFGGTVIANGWANVYGELTFDLTERTVNDTYIVDNIANLYIDDFSSCSISVTANQAEGTYILAGNAAEFDKTVTVYSGTTSYGTVTVGGTALTYNGRTYTLALNNSNLVLTIGNTVTPPVAGDQVQVYSSGTLVKQGKTLTGETIVSGANNSMFIYKDGTANETIISSGGFINISSGGTANNTSVYSSGTIKIYSSGIAEDTYISGSRAIMHISSGGAANNTLVDAGGVMNVSQGGLANSSIVNKQGNIHVYNGGRADNVFVNNGQCYVYSGGTANNISAVDGAYWAYSHGVINNVTMTSSTFAYIYGGEVNDITVVSGGIIYNDGVTRNTKLQTSGRLHVSGGGFSYNTDIGATCYLYIKLGEAKNTTVSSGGRMYIFSGGTHRLKLTMEEGAFVSADDGGIVDFTVSEWKTTNGYLVNNLSLIKGTPTYTITVSADQTEGTYKLAQGADNFTGTLTIGDGTVDYGSITVNGDDFVYNGVTYSLDQLDGNLTLTIGGGATPPVAGDQVRVFKNDILIKQGKILIGEQIEETGNDKMIVYKDGIASNTVVSSGGAVFVSSGGVLKDTTVRGNLIDKIVPLYVPGINVPQKTNLAVLNVYGGGYAENLDIYKNGRANFIGKEMPEDYDALYASGKNVNVSSGGSVYISGGEITNLLVSSGGDVYVCGLRDVSYVDVNGRICNGKIKSGGELTIGDGTELMGDIIFGGTIIVNGTADVIGEVTFDLSERDTADRFIVNNLAYLNMSMSSFYTISVTADQANGTYKLAQGAEGFTGTLSIGDGTVNYGSLTVNGADLSYNGATYSLDQLDGDLTLTITGAAAPPVTNGLVQVFKGENLVKQGNILTGETIIGTGNDKIIVYKDGIAKDTQVNNDGNMFVSEGGLASNTTLRGAEYIYVKDEDPRYGVYSPHPGTMNVFAGGIASNTTIYEGGKLYASGGIANDVMVHSYGFVCATDGGVVNNITTDEDWCWIGAKNGGTINNIINYGGSIGIDKDGTLNNAVLNGSPDITNTGVYVYAGGIAKNTIANSGHVTAYEGGTIDTVKVNTAAFMRLEEGAIICGKHIYAGKVNADGNIDAVNADVIFDISERKEADNYIINNISYFNAKSYSITVSANQANGTYKLAQGAGSFTGTLTIGDGSVYYGSITVNGADFSYNGATYSLDQLDGNLTLTIGTNVTPPIPGDQVQVFKGNNLVKQGKILTGETIIGTDNDKMIVYKDGIANKTVVSSAALMYVSNGGVANETTVDSAGRIHVSRGGIVNNTTLSGIFVWGSYGAMNIHNGGTANNTQILSGGFVTVSAGGTADNVNVNNRGQLAVFGNATDITVYKGGEMRVYNGAYVSDLIAKQDAFFGVEVTPDTYVKGSYADSAFEIKNGLVADYTIHKGYVHLKRGGKANGVTVNNKTWLRVYENCTASNTQVNGSMYIYKDGTAENTTVMYGGSMLIEGGKHTHSLNIADGAFVSAYNGGIVDFTVSERKTTDGYLINNISLIKGTPTYTITVSANQANGTYKLAQGADNFTGTLTIGDGSVDYGSITVNGADFSYNGVIYSLDQLNGNLTLTITNKPAIVENDLDGNGLADVVLVHTKQGYSGAWLTTGDASIIKWGNLSYLTSDIEILGTGKLHGTENDGQDIFFTDGKSVGAWNVVKGQVTGYKNIMNVNATTNVLGLGDFNGDEATDILLRSTNGDLGYFGTDGTGWKYLKGLGSEWDVAAIGDLNGDGLDDIIVRHDAGFAGTFLTQKNGTVKWANLDTLASNMTIVGTGDFNGDGVDDVLLRNESNGWVGTWLVEDGKVDSFMGLCTNKNDIEQIADFNGDGIDDLRIRSGSDVGVLYVNGADDTTWQYFKSVGKEWDTSFAALA